MLPKRSHRPTDARFDKTPISPPRASSGVRESIRESDEARRAKILSDRTGKVSFDGTIYSRGVDDPDRFPAIDRRFFLDEMIKHIEAPNFVVSNSPFFRTKTELIVSPPREFIIRCIRIASRIVYPTKEYLLLSAPLVKEIPEEVNWRLAFAIACLPKLHTERGIDETFGNTIALRAYSPEKAIHRYRAKWLFSLRELYYDNHWGWAWNLMSSFDSYHVENEREEKLGNSFFPIYLQDYKNYQEKKSREANEARLRHEKAERAAAIEIARREAEESERQRKQSPPVTFNDKIHRELEKMFPNNYAFSYPAYMKFSLENSQVVIYFPFNQLASMNHARNFRRSDISAAVETVMGKKLPLDFRLADALAAGVPAQ